MPLDVRGLTPLLQVYDMPTSIRFYCDLLGFEIINHSPRLANGSFHWAWLRLGMAELMLNTAYEFDRERPSPPDQARVIAHADTVLYISCPHLDEAYEILTRKGIPASKPATAPYGMRQVHFSDPDGYELCFQFPVENPA